MQDLLTDYFRDYVTGIFVVAPKPTTFKVLLHNGQMFFLIYGPKSYIAKIAGKRYFGLKSDIWSSGVVLYAMICVFLPFEDPKTSNLYKKILAGEFKIPKFLS